MRSRKCRISGPWPWQGISDIIARILYFSFSHYLAIIIISRQYCDIFYDIVCQTALLLLWKFGPFHWLFVLFHIVCIRYIFSRFNLTTFTFIHFPDSYNGFYWDAVSPPYSSIWICVYQINSNSEDIRNGTNLIKNCILKKIAQLRTHASRVHFAKIHFG